MTSRKVQQANKASAAELATSITANQDVNGVSHYLSVSTAPDLSEKDRICIWDIFEKNMHDLYVNSSFGWDPQSKRKELFAAESRFLLVRPILTGLSFESIDHSESLHLVAYAMFRFERENKEDVVYCYEIQVSGSVRRLGFGKLLAQQLNRIGSGWGMQKIMLTVLTANVGACKFYSALGFSTDPTSPCYEDSGDEWEDENQVDYRVLSMKIQVSAA